MSWCDSLASTPIVGLRFEPNFRPAEEILAAMSPVLNREMTDERPAFQVESIEPFNLVFNTESGYRYTFDQANASVAFNHRIRAKAASAGPPTMELISQAAPFTELLEKVIERLIEAVDLLAINKTRTIKRVGIVSVTQVTLADAPPGIIDLFGQIGSPLGGQVRNFSANVTTEVSRSDTSFERCAHTLTLPEPPDTLITLQLDWQRTHLTPTRADKSHVVEVLNSGKRDALSYFERVAEGGLNDVGN